MSASTILTSKRTITAIVCSLSLAAMAATPVAVWDGDFTATQTGFTLNRSGNALSQDNSTITIDQSVGVKVDFDSAMTSGMTVMFRYAGLALDADKTMATSFGQGSQENSTGVRLVSTTVDNETVGVPSGFHSTSTTYNTGATQNNVNSSMSSGVMAFCYTNGDGTQLYYINNGSASVVYSCSTLKFGADFTSARLKGCAIGGERDKSGATLFPAATGMKITGIAIFEGILSEDEMKAYCFPSEIQTINVASSTSVSAINASFESANYKGIKIVASDGVTITMDEPFAANSVSFSASNPGGWIKLGANSAPSAAELAKLDFTEVQGGLVRSWLSSSLRVVGFNFNAGQGASTSTALADGTWASDSSSGSGSTTALFSDGISKLTWSSRGYYQFGDKTSFLHGYLDDNSSKSPAITLSHVPFKTYDVIIYCATDSGSSYKFSAKQVNGTYYTWDDSEEKTISTDNAYASWGHGGDNPAAYGVNAIRINGLSGALTISGGIYQNDNDLKTRGCIAAIQIINNTATYSAEITGDVTWSTGAGLSNVSGDVEEGIVLNNDLDVPITLNLDGTISSPALSLTGSGTTIIRIDNNATVNVGAYSFLGVTGEVVIDDSISTAIVMPPTTGTLRLRGESPLSAIPYYNDVLTGALVVDQPLSVTDFTLQQNKALFAFDTYSTNTFSSFKFGGNSGAVQTIEQRGGSITVTGTTFNDRDTDAAPGDRTSTVLGHWSGSVNLRNFGGTFTTVAGIRFGWDGTINWTIGDGESADDTAVVSIPGWAAGGDWSHMTGRSNPATMTLQKGGSLVVGSYGLQCISGNVTMNLAGGKLQASANTSIGNVDGTTELSHGTTTIIATGEHDVTLNTVLGGTGSLTKTGSGRLLFGRNPTATGTLYVNGGEVPLPSGFSWSGSVAVGAGGVFTGDAGAEGVTSTVASGGTMNLRLSETQKGQGYTSTAVLAVGAVVNFYDAAGERILATVTGSELVSSAVFSGVGLIWYGNSGEWSATMFDGQNKSASSDSLVVFADNQTVPYSAVTVTVTADQEVNGLGFTADTTAYTLTGGNTVSVGGNVVLDGSAPVTLGANVVFSAGKLSGTGPLVLDPGVGNEYAMPGNNTEYTGEAIIKSGTVKMDNPYAFGPFGRANVVRVKGGAALSTGCSNNGASSETSKLVLEEGATYTTYQSISDEKLFPFSWLKLEGNARVLADVGNIGITRQYNYPTTVDLGTNTLTKAGANTFYLSSATISGTGMIYVAGGTIYFETEYWGNTISTCNDGTIKIGNGAFMTLGGYGTGCGKLSVKNLVIDGSVIAKSIEKNVLTVTGYVTGNGTTPMLTLGANAVFKPTGTGYLTITESLTLPTATVGEGDGAEQIPYMVIDLTDALASGVTAIPLFKVGSAENLPAAEYIGFIYPGQTVPSPVLPRGWKLSNTLDGCGYKLSKGSFSIHLR